MPIKSIPSKSLGERLGLGLAELNDPEDDVEAKVKRTCISFQCEGGADCQDYCAAETATLHLVLPTMNLKMSLQPLAHDVKVVKAVARPRQLDVEIPTCRSMMIHVGSRNVPSFLHRVNLNQNHAQVG